MFSLSGYKDLYDRNSLQITIKKFISEKNLGIWSEIHFGKGFPSRVPVAWSRLDHLSWLRDNPVIVQGK